jgi:chromosome segregation ATPase
MSGNLIPEDEDSFITQAEYIHEEEMRNIIQSFKDSLSHFSIQIDHLNKENKKLESQVVIAQSHCEKYEHERDSIRLEYEKSMTELEMYKKRLEILDNSIQCASTLVNSCDLNCLKNRVLAALPDSYPDQPTEESVEISVESLESQIKQLEAQNSRLVSENEALKQYFTELVKKELTETKCKNCKKLFIIKQNSESSCISHPGRVKYYSCKGCGADPYHTCCNLCSNCSPGCRRSHHVAV